MKLNGGVVKKLREGMDCTQEEFVALSDIDFSLSTLQRIEQGQPVSQSNALDVAAALGVDLSDLILVEQEAEFEEGEVTPDDKAPEQQETTSEDDVGPDLISKMDAVLDELSQCYDFYSRSIEASSMVSLLADLQRIFANLEQSINQGKKMLAAGRFGYLLQLVGRQKGVNSVVLVERVQSDLDWYVDVLLQLEHSTLKNRRASDVCVQKLENGLRELEQLICISSEKMERSDQNEEIGTCEDVSRIRVAANEVPLRISTFQGKREAFELALSAIKRLFEFLKDEDLRFHQVYQKLQILNDDRQWEVFSKKLQPNLIDFFLGFSGGNDDVSSNTREALRRAF